MSIQRSTSAASKLTVLDLFSGAGGFSLGFKAADWDVIAAIEVDPWACQTYRQNLGEHVLEADISQIGDSEFRKYRGVDAVIGGPPCQGFSISAGARRKKDDPRNLLFKEYLRVVHNVRPQFVVFENVPAIVNAAVIINELKGVLGSLGYTISERVVDAADFGVPQRRQRYILLGSLLGNKGIALQATHSVAGLLSERWITVGDAIGDLPNVVPRTLTEDALVPYNVEGSTEYQRSLRSSSGVVANHIPMRHTERLVERFRNIPVGGNEADVWLKHAPRRRSQGQDTAGSLYDQNHRRMSALEPAPTITASFYSSFVHPTAPRNLTVREAARLQGFADDFRFYGKRTTLSKSLLRRKGMIGDLYLDQFNQVGNAVPPLLARAIAVGLATSAGLENRAVYA